MCKSLGQALNLHRFCPPSTSGYQVELLGWLQLQKIVLHSPQGDEAVSEFQYLGVINVKVCRSYWGYLDNKHTLLPLLLSQNLQEARRVRIQPVPG